MVEQKNPVPWLSDEEWRKMPTHLRALHVAATEHAHYGDKNLEVQGPNRGPNIRKYSGSIGLTDGLPWCGVFVAWCLQQAGYPVNGDKRFASACHILHTLGDPIEMPIRGAVGGWCDKKRWRGHVFFVSRVRKVGPVVILDTIEGNTNKKGAREGIGIFRRKRVLTPKMRFVAFYEE